MWVVFKYHISLFLFLLIVKGTTLYGQNDLGFFYNYDRGLLNHSDQSFDSPIFSKIKLRFPNGNICQLFADTVSRYDFSRKNFFKEQGDYILKIYFSSDKYGKDSIDYQFGISGKEIKVDISISFYYDGKYYKNGDYWEKKEKVPQCHVSVFKYVPCPESIAISLNKVKESNEFYKGPFFDLKNNSKDTIYGVYLPGYFWGKLFFTRDDSTIVEKMGTIDEMFGDSPPLYPDSTKIAMVGSFGLFKQLPPLKYRYELLLSNKWESLGVGVFLDKDDFVWWAGTKEYYKLTYDFEVK